MVTVPRERTVQPQALSRSAHFDMTNAPWLLAQATEASSILLGREMGIPKG